MELIIKGQKIMHVVPLENKIVKRQTKRNELSFT